MDKKESVLIIALAQCGMNVTDAADKSHWSRPQFLRCLEKIKIKTDLDPLNFFDLGELYTIAREILGDDYELL